MTVGSQKQLTFSVMACHDARVALRDVNANDSSDMYEISIGGWHNKKTVVRTKINDNNFIMDSYDEVGILDCTVFRDFWITWYNYKIRCGKGKAFCAGEILQYDDTRAAPYDVNVIAISTGWGATGRWIIDEGMYDGKIVYFCFGKNRIFFWLKSYSVASMLQLH